jgi:hypothetical protein
VDTNVLEEHTASIFSPEGDFNFGKHENLTQLNQASAVDVQTLIFVFRPKFTLPDSVSWEGALS